MKDKVFVFDLDDTLYKEIEYKRSGFNYLLSVLEKLYPDQKTPALSDVLSSSDNLEFLIRHYQLPLSSKESLLWIYRTHVPSIELDPKVKNVIPEPVDISLVSIAIAITELETDENGYSGYRHVLESLQEQEGFKE